MHILPDEGKRTVQKIAEKKYYGWSESLFDRETVQGGKKTGQTKKKEEKGATIAPLKTAQKIAEKKYYRWSASLSDW